MRVRNRGSWLVVLLTLAAASACSDATGPDRRASASGQWAGSFSHPAYDGGSLSLTLVDAGGPISGTYRLTLSRRVGSRVSVEQSGGDVTGSFANGALTLGLKRTNGDIWLLEGRLRGSSAAGEWSTARAIRGTFDVAR